ncbi:helix-turn-helix domain-containing protein [Saccharopolyspora erythraea]|uniref:helix-turn-helix domain-containing protein n=1 Tax=Saccharopolyspora erythraea TaxID=1836 RepID=UPI001BA74590|nr:helix-turn-helix transcriptional regulator [Saccharopolyspora erythraea]QUH00027.1 helix-turn-helix domain-containing protein [Saccharopolyspora erythraea]
MPGTTPKARAIGVELRRAREDAGLSARQLAEKIGKSHTTVGRWESGERSPRPVDVATVLSALGADNHLREELIELARNSNGRHWVASSLPEQQRQLAALLEIERDATLVVSASPLLVPGLLQTSRYARAIIGAGGVPADEVETRVAVRLGRRDSIMRSDPAQLLALIDETVLRRVIGAVDVLAEQLRAICEVMQRPNVEVRIIPLSAGWHPALEGPFDLFESNNRARVVHVENRRSGQFFHEQDDVKAYQDAVSWLRNVSHDPEESLQLIADVIDEMEAEL